MNEWIDDINNAIVAFKIVAAMCSVDLNDSDFEIEFLPAPHRPPTKMPAGKMAVYGFWGDECWLKIGIAGPNSAARFTSQHYNPASAPSTLARSLTTSLQPGMLNGFDPLQPGLWIRERTHRVNVFLSSRHPRELLALFEAFLHLRLRPRYER